MHTKDQHIKTIEKELSLYIKDKNNICATEITAFIDDFIEQLNFKEV